MIRLALFALSLSVTVGLGLCTFANPRFNDLPACSVLFFILAAFAIRQKPLKHPFVFVHLLAAALWLGTGLMSRSPQLSPKVLVYGVDGATFAVIDSHADSLPAFKRLAEEGTRAQLTSIEPMFSPVLWTTIASGRSPDEHGVRGFRVHADDCKVARFWDIGEQAGMGLGMYKWLVDYPPRKVDGFWVPSWLAPAPETWPPELSVVKELELSRRLRRQQVAQVHSTPALAWGLLKAGVRLSTFLKAGAWSAQERILHPSPIQANVEMQRIRGWIDRDVFMRQMEIYQPEIATFTYYATDGLAHLYWDRYEAGGTEVLTAYQQADEILGEFRAALGPESRLIVVSDHGFKAMDGSGMAGQFSPTTERLHQRLAEQLGEVDVTRVGHKLTVALKSSEKRQQAEQWLKNLLDAQGQPVYTLSDIPDSANTIALTLANEQVSPDRMAKDTVGGEPLSQYLSLSSVYTGTHREDGVFYAAGPGVPAGQKLSPLSLYDAAPTILAAAGLPAAKNMRGTAAIFPELPRVESWDGLVEKLTWLKGESGVDEERLKALGYVE